MFHGLSDFYQSKQWDDFRKVVIAERTSPDGFVYDEVTGKPILKRYDMILHHCNTFLTEDNVHDYSVSLNPENIQIVSHHTHNKLHARLGARRKEVFLVYGSPLSGKTTWIKENQSRGDLIIDMDDIWQCISGLPRYDKPRCLNAVAFFMRDSLMDAAKQRLGHWQNCYICGGFPLISERERIVKTYGARLVFIDTPKEECLRRLEADSERDQDEWTDYIEKWWRRFR